MSSRRRRHDFGTSSLSTHGRSGLVSSNPTTRRPYGSNPTSRSTAFPYKKANAISSSTKATNSVAKKYIESNKYKYKPELGHSSRLEHFSTDSVLSKTSINGSVGQNELDSPRERHIHGNPNISENQNNESIVLYKYNYDNGNEKLAKLINDNVNIEIFEEPEVSEYPNRNIRSKYNIVQQRKNHNHSESNTLVVPVDHKIQGFCGTCIKFCMTIFNIIIMIGAMAIIILACWTLYDDFLIQKLVGSNLYANIAYILIASSSFTVLVCIFGCIGASHEIKFILVLYFIIIGFLYVSMMVGGIGCYLFQDELYNTMEKTMKLSLHEYGKSPRIDEAWNMVQESCCGVHSWEEWPRHKIPSSCQPKEGNKTAYFQEGCLEAAHEYLQLHATKIGSLSLSLAFVMLLGMVFSCALYRMIENASHIYM